ncbi:MAG TPA: hypothetical protein DDZ51_28280 [Planctomycetaceae bacterium]|nr:hypothetical protein [Planctomycetaceae bacterium]
MTDFDTSGNFPHESVTVQKVAAKVPLQLGRNVQVHETAPTETAKSATSRLENHLYTMYKWLSKLFLLRSKIFSVSLPPALG